MILNYSWYIWKPCLGTSNVSPLAETDTANITQQKVIDSDSGASIYDKITDKVNISEEISSHKNSSKIINNTPPY